jgi:hypothetical protein
VLFTNILDDLIEEFFFLLQKKKEKQTTKFWENKNINKVNLV